MNYQIDQYASWHPNKNAIATDAFGISWSELNFDAFPPFNVIGAAIVIVRLFGDHDYTVVENTGLVSHDGTISEKFPDTSSSKYTLRSKRSTKHLLYPKMKLLAVHLFGKVSQTQTFQEKLGHLYIAWFWPCLI